jgi:outer membrane protein assembly factor BamB
MILNMILKMSRVAGVLVAVAGTAALGAQSASTDWTQWRGANRDGGVAAFKAPARWPETLTLRWRQEIGLGYSTPVVVGSGVYTFARSGENEAVTAFDAATGKQIWQVSYPAPYTLVKAAAAHGMGPKSTPVYADGRLFTFGISGILSAIDAKTGKLLWQKPAPEVGPTFTTSQSALVDRGLLIVHVGGNNGGALTAFDPATGTVKWQWTGDGPGYGSPIVAEFGGTRQVITFTLDNLVGVSAETGELLWLRPHKAPSQVNANTPIAYRDLVIVSGNGDPITAFRVSRQGGKWVTEDAWKNEDLFMHLTNGVVVGDALFSLSPQNRGHFFFIDAKTGKTLWTGEPRTAENAAIAKAGTLLFALKADGELLIVDGSNPTAFTPLRRYKVSDAATWAQSAISGNRIVVKDLTTGALWAIE